MSCVCHAFTSVHCCLVVTWRERTDLLALVCDVYCDFITFPFGILGPVWYLVVSMPDPCCLSYFMFYLFLLPLYVQVLACFTWHFVWSLSSLTICLLGNFAFFSCLLMFDCFFTKTIQLSLFEIWFQKHHLSVKQFGFRSDPTVCRVWSGSKLFTKFISTRWH